MPVPSSLADLSTTAASNSPAGTDAIGTSLDDYLRTTQALLKQSVSRGTDIASSSSITIPANGNYCVVTGTTTINSIADSWNGRVVTLKFSGALTLTNSASLVLPGGHNIVTEAGDCIQLVNESTGVWRCVSVERYNGNGFINVKDFGAVGDGITDDTAAFNQLIFYINSNAPIMVEFPSSTYMIGQLDPITASNVTILSDGAILKSIANSMTLNDESLLTVTGNTFRIVGATFDGNQLEYSSGANCQLLTASGSGHRFESITVKNSPGRGAIFTISNSQFSNCHFDDNAGLGMQMEFAKNIEFVNCTWDGNGYGFQNTWNTNAFVAFGFALRHRSNHITLTNCRANKNGRDGMNVNQGSYAIKFIGCQCIENDDGGFTIAADNDGTGYLSDGEVCFDLEYIDCEAANNYTSGLVAYAPCFNVNIIGGRYYNNNRVAGVLSQGVSYFNGVYFASGSKAIDARGVKCYDDRQLRSITNSSVSGSQATITATSWVSGTKDYYPRVAFYNASMEFQGYGNIVSEATGTVVVTTSDFNPVTLSSINSSWFITQSVQHNGFMLDNGCSGSVDVVGSGHRSGPSPAIQGQLLLSAGYANGQNINLPSGINGRVELLVNPSFDSNISNWSFSAPAGSSATHYTATPYKKSPGSVKLIGGTSSYAYFEASLQTDAILYASNQFVRFSGWVYCNVPGGASIALLWLPGTYYSTTAQHSGTGWEYLSICAFMPPEAVQILCRVQVSTQQTAYFDEFTLRPVSLPKDGVDLYAYSRNLPY